jgi:hypothetical protein
VKHVAAEKLPFLKRAPFGDEREYRVVYTDHKVQRSSVSYTIDRGWIDRIVLSPWMHKSLGGSVSRALKSIPGCSGVVVKRTALVDNDTWKALAARARVTKPASK